MINRQNYKSFTLNGTTENQFEKDIKEKINQALNIAINENSMQNLASGIDKLYNKTSEKDMWTAINLWNANIKGNMTTDTTKDVQEQYNSINNNNNKEQLYIYYEYMQFKRARFNCKQPVEYDSKTGRITKMEFVFNGKIE